MLALALGIAFEDAFLWPGSLLRRAVALVLAAAWLNAGTRAPLVSLAAFLLGAACLAPALEAARSGAELPPQARVVEGRVCALNTGSGWQRVRLCEVRGVDSERAVPATVRLDRRVPKPALVVGDRIRAALRIRPLWPLRNPGGGDGERTAARVGEGARAALVDDSLLVRLEPGPSARGLLERVRGRLSRGLAPAGEGAATLRALALGDRSDLGEALPEALRRLGLSHLLAISGLHLTALALSTGWLAQRALRRVVPVARRMDVRPLAVAAGLLLAGVYAALAGFGWPVQRAWLCLAAVAIGSGVGSEIDGFRALALAAAVVLVRAPHALFELSAQLSFAASLGIVVLARTQASQGPGASGASGDDGARRLSRGIGFLAAGLSLGAVAISATGPLLAARGLAAPAIGLVTNLIAVPAMTVLGVPVLATSAVLAALPLAWSWPDVALETIGRAIVYVQTLAVEAARALPPDGPSSRALAPPLVMVGLGLGLSVGRLRGTAVRVAACIGLSVLLRLASGLAAPGLADGLRVVFLDVGAGDATLVETRAARILIDAGPLFPFGGDLVDREIAPALSELGVDRLDALVLSHADADHRGGAPRLLERVPVGRVWLPASGVDDPGFDAVKAAATRAGVPVRALARDAEPIVLGDLRIDVLWPPATGVDRLPRNERSLVLGIEASGLRLLAVGDIGRRVEARLVREGARLRADLLKVGHHGSRRSSSVEFLERVAPRLAVVSAPCLGARGLPATAALRRLARVGAALAWTGRDGAIQVVAPSSGIPGRTAGEAAASESATRGRGGFRVVVGGAPRRCPPDPAIVRPGGSARMPAVTLPRRWGSLRFAAPPNVPDARGPRAVAGKRARVGAGRPAIRGRAREDDRREAKQRGRTGMQQGEAWAKRVRAEVQRAVIGQDAVIDRALVALLTGGHVLLEGMPGLAKTLLVKTLGRVLGLDFERIQFTPDLLPSDVVGTMVFHPKDGEFSVHRGPVFAHLVLADEINRAPAKVQSALLEAMQERQVTLGGASHRLPDPFLVMATQNPIEQEGTYPLPEAQTDRFLFKLLVDYPSETEEREMMELWGGLTEVPAPDRVSHASELLTLRAAVEGVFVSPALKGYMLALVRATRARVDAVTGGRGPLAFGASPRASLALLQATQALAWIRGEAHATPETVQAIFHDTLRHRIGLTFEAEAEGMTPDAILTEVVAHTSVPSLG